MDWNKPSRVVDAVGSDRLVGRDALKISAIVLHPLFLAGFCYGQIASPESTATGVPLLTPEASVSLITETPGEELYTVFGHSSIRVRDLSLGFDRMYNYGAFDFRTEHFYLKFARGNLLYEMNVVPAETDIPEVAANGQGLSEVVLELGSADKQRLFDALEANLLPANRYYKYDFLQDNCSTRIQGLMNRVLNVSLVDDSTHGATYREMLDVYLRRLPWVRFGVYLLLGARIDRAVQPSEAPFLPANLENAFLQAHNNDHRLVRPRVMIANPERRIDPPWYVDPESILTGVLVAWVVIWMFRGYRSSRWISAVAMIILGGAGTFLAVFWSITEHWEAYDNWNLAWAWPTHLVFGLLLPFWPVRAGWLRRRYSVLSLAGLSLFAVCSAWLPQRFHPAIFPLICLLGWRFWLESRRKEEETI